MKNIILTLALLIAVPAGFVWAKDLSAKSSNGAFDEIKQEIGGNRFVCIHSAAPESVEIRWADAPYGKYVKGGNFYSAIESLCLSTSITAAGCCFTR